MGSDALKTMSEVTRDGGMVAPSRLLCMYTVCWLHPEKLPGAKVPALGHTISHILPSSAEPGPPRIPEHLGGLSARAGAEDALSPPRDRHVLPQQRWLLKFLAQMAPKPNTYCPALSNVCPGQINFS